MLRRGILVAGAALAFASGAAVAQPASNAQERTAAPQRASELLPPRLPAALAVSSPSFGNGADIPFRYTLYEDNVFPGLQWSAGPAGTKSYVIIFQDPDDVGRRGPQVFLHWTMVNIPPAVTSLPVGLTAAQIPAGASNGPNVRGPNQPYMGPETPPGPKHRYFFQLFALDTVLPSAGTLTFDQLLAAMKGHVLASGELHGLGRAPDQKPDNE